VGVLGVYAGASAANAAKAASVAAREFRALCRSVDAAELARAKAQLKGSLFMARESAAARAEQAAAQLMVYDRLIPPSEIAARIDAVQPADIARAGDRALKSGRSAAALLGPKSALPAADAFHAALFDAG